MQDVFDVELRLKRNEYLVTADVKSPLAAIGRHVDPSDAPDGALRSGNSGT
jgi:hypothetical protein